MPIRSETVVCDVSRGPCDAPPTVVAMQGDEGIRLTVQVTDGGVPKSLSGLTAELMCDTGPDLVEAQMAVDGSTATVDTPAALTARAQTVRPYVRLSQGDDVVASTQPFELRVTRAADLSDAQEAGYVGKLEQVAKQYEASLAQVSAAYQASLQQLSAQAQSLIDELQAALQDMGLPVYHVAGEDGVPARECFFGYYDETMKTYVFGYEDGEPEGGQS